METALTLPLLMFLVLGSLQLFLLLQARILAQHAAYRAVRAGSLNHGDCVPMMHMAIVSVLPTVARTETPTALAKAFRKHRDNRLKFNGFDGPMIELVRQSPRPNQWTGQEDLQFDDPSRAGGTLTLELRMVYWYYMRIPFANWVMSRMFLAHQGYQEFKGQNVLVLTERKAKWKQVQDTLAGSWPGGSLGNRMRKWAKQDHYLFPLQVNATMRMMTPARRTHFKTQSCPLSL